MNELIIDYNKPVLDLTYQNISTLNLDKSADEVKALILTGNPIDDFNFLKCFQNLQLLHGDSMNVCSFQDIRLDVLPKIQHLVLRQNLFENFQFLRDSESLQLLDVSQNKFLEGCEPTLEACFPALKRLLFGLVGNNNTQNGAQPTLSKTSLNSLTLFQKFFANRFYEDDKIIFSDLNQIVLDNLQFQVTTNPNKLQFDLRKVNDMPVKNLKVVLTCYAVITGFEIQETNQQVLHLTDFLPPNIFALGIKECFQMKQINYPTQQLNKNQEDINVFNILSNRKADQQNLKLNYNVVTVEMAGYMGIFLIDRKTNQPCAFLQQQEFLQKQIQNQSGIKLTLTKTLNQSKIQVSDLDSTAKTGRSAIKFNDPIPIQFRNLKVTPYPDIQQVSYYMTKKPKNQLIKDVQEQIFQFTEEKVPESKSSELLSAAFRQFNTENRQIVSDDEIYVYLMFNFMAMQIPIKVVMNFIKSLSSTQDLMLSAATYQKFILAQINFGDEKKLIFTEYPVKYVPNISSVKLEAHNSLLVVNIFENIEGQKKRSLYQNYWYIYFRNNAIVKETIEPFLDLKKEQIAIEGLFKVIVQVKDDDDSFVGDEVESDNIYLKTMEEEQKMQNSKQEQENSMLLASQQRLQSLEKLIETKQKELEKYTIVSQNIENNDDYKILEDAPEDKKPQKIQLTFNSVPQNAQNLMDEQFDNQFIDEQK